MENNLMIIPGNKLILGIRLRNSLNELVMNILKMKMKNMNRMLRVTWLRVD